MSVLRRYLLPGLVFQSVVIGGGYATGRELIEFFMPAGPSGGLLGMLVTMLIWSVVTAASLEFARVTRAYDYRSFFTGLLGRGWFVFEIGYVLLLVLVLSVIAAACNEIGASLLGVPAPVGAALLMAAVGAVVFFGNEPVARVLASLGLLLYAIYIVLFVWCLGVFGDRIAETLAAPVNAGEIVSGGLRYAGYNLVVIVSVLFCARQITSRREAVISGLLVGPIALIPGVLFFTSMMAFHPQIGNESVPSVYLVFQLGVPWFEIVFQLAVFGTLVATGAGLLHAVNERTAKAFESRGKKMPPWARSAIAIALMVFSAAIASAFGLVALIAKGYGTLTWFFILVIVVPVLTVGIWRIRKA